MALNRLIYETEEEDREVLGKMTSLPVLEGLGVRRWVEEGLMGEIKDPFQRSNGQQVLGGERFSHQLKGSLESKTRAAQELRTVIPY
jgi:hypothetical protein